MLRGPTQRSVFLRAREKIDTNIVILGWARFSLLKEFLLSDELQPGCKWCHQNSLVHDAHLVHDVLELILRNNVHLEASLESLLV